ncbi:MAG: hypothetical protein AAGI63_14285, partial [Planctomycetota bacterium]
MLTVTPIEVTGGYELQLSYEPGETIEDVEDIYLRTNSDGELQYATESSFEPYIDLGTNLSDGSVDSLSIEVTFSRQSNNDYADLIRNLFGNTLSTLSLGNIDAPGVDLSFQGFRIDVESGRTINTRTLANGADPLTAGSIGDSGDLSIDAPVQHIEGTLLTHVGPNDTTNTAGDITIQATGNLDDIASGFIVAPGNVLDISATQATVDIEGATIRGRDITIDVESDASDLFDDEDTPGGWGEPLQEWVGGLNVLAGVALSQSFAELDVQSSQIEGRNVSLSSEAASDAEATVLSFYAAVAYGHSIPHATVDVREGSSIVTTGDLSISTRADSDLSIIATQNLIGTSTVVEKRNVTLAGAYSDVVSSAELSSDSTLTVGDDLNVDVFATREHNTQSNSAAYGDGTLGLALNVAVHESTLEALIDGDVTTVGNMKVEAELETIKNDFNATSTVGTGSLGGELQRATRFDAVGDAFGAAFGTGSAVTAGSNNNEWARLLGVADQQPSAYGTAGAVNVGISFNDVEVRIGEGAEVNVDGNLTLEGRVEEFPETSAISFLNSSNSQYAGSTDRTYSQRETGTSIALTGGYFENEIDVFIGSGATVNVGGDLTIDSTATMPYHIQWAWDTRTDEFEPARVSTVTDKLNYNLGIQNGFFTSWAEAIASAQERAYGGMLNLLFTDTHNYAYIGDNAIVTVGGDLAIHADTNVDTINFVGSPLAPFNASGGRGIGAAAMAVGYLNDTTAKVNQGAQIIAGSMLVFANNRGRTISIGVQGGLADGGSFNALSRIGNFNGAFTARFVDNRTVAKVSKQASLNLSGGQAAVPLSFRDISQNETSLISSTPMFDPFESLNEDASELRVDPGENRIRLPYAH